MNGLSLFTNLSYNDYFSLKNKLAENKDKALDRIVENSFTYQSGLKLSEGASKKLALKPKFIFKSNGEVVLITRAQAPTNLVIQGGGAKGLVYGIYLKTLNENLALGDGTLIENLKHVSGTSAGSMMAYLLACGIDIGDIDSFMQEQSIIDTVIGDEEGSGLANVETGLGIFKAGKLAAMLKNFTNKEVFKYINSLDLYHNLKKIVADDRWEKHNIKQAEVDNFFHRCTKGLVDGVTFKDLEILHILNPKKFKSLHVTGFDSAEKTTYYFNSQNTPDLSCHIAVRISMSIPLVFESIILKGITFTDGGEGSNVPSEAVEKATGISAKPYETLAVVLHNGGSSYKALHSDEGRCHPKLRDACKHELVESSNCFGPTRFDYFGLAEKWDKDKIHHLGSRVAVVPHGEIGTLSFMCSASVLAQARNEAKEAALNYAKIHSNEAIYRVFNNVAEALAAL